MQTLSDKEVHEWLYAINPLLAGQIRYPDPSSPLENFLQRNVFSFMYIYCRSKLSRRVPTSPAPLQAPPSFIEEPVVISEPTDK